MVSPICLELIKGGITLAVALLGAWWALHLYFRQKEYELIKQRYLEGGVDIVAAEVEQASGVLHHNWARCLNIIKAYRDEKTDFDIQELEKGFQLLDSSKIHRIPHHRISNLTHVQGVMAAHGEFLCNNSIIKGIGNISSCWAFDRCPHERGT